MLKEGYLKNGVYYRHNNLLSGRDSIVFIHGLSGCCAAWKPYEDYFGDDYNLLSFDLRGHGRSFKKKDAAFYSLDQIADDLYEISITLGIRKIFLTGHSYGALLALDFSAKYPEMINGLVLLAPDYHINKTIRGKATQLFLNIGDIFLMGTFTEGYGREIDYSRFTNTADWDLRRIYADIKNTSIHVYRHCLDRSGFFDAENIIPGINVPVLIIHGKNDSIFPVSYSVEMSKKFTNARLRILDNANHILVLNNSNEIKDEIDKFLKNSKFNNSTAGFR